MDFNFLKNLKKSTEFPYLFSVIFFGGGGGLTGINGKWHGKSTCEVTDKASYYNYLKDQSKVISCVFYGRWKTFFSRRKYTYILELETSQESHGHSQGMRPPSVSKLTQTSWQDEPNKNCLPGLWRLEMPSCRVSFAGKVNPRYFQSSLKVRLFYNFPKVHDQWRKFSNFRRRAV